MVFIGVYRLDEERRVFLARGVEAFFEGGFDIRLQPLPPVLGAPDDMVLQFVGAMVEGFCLHATSLRSRSGFHSSPGSSVRYA